MAVNKYFYHIKNNGRIFFKQINTRSGSITTKTGSTVAAGSTVITNASVTGIGASNLIVNSNYIAGTKVHSVTAVSGGIGTVYADRASTNTASATNQTVNFLGVTTAFTASATEKSILIGGTFANNTDNQVALTVELYDASTSVGVALASEIPVPAGSSFVISDTGKTILEPTDELRVYCNAANGIDATLSILTGVSQWQHKDILEEVQEMVLL